MANPVIAIPSDLDAMHQLLDTRARETAAEMISWRHYLHQHPELSNREKQTAAFIAEHLESFGLDEVRTGITGHGVIGVLRGGQPGEGVVALRADMDALPVPDESGVDFASQVVDKEYPGGPYQVSHACGHDCHMAMLLGAMRILAEQKKNLPGTVVAVFQPAEEGAPAGEEGGARTMMQADVLADLHPTMAFGMHVQPAPKGVVTLLSGNQFAASCMVKIEITGKQVHASTPWAGIDPMPAVGAILTGIGQIYRQTDAFSPFTVSIGHIQDVGRFNVVGGKVTLFGTIRALSDNVMEQVQQRVSRLAKGSAEAMGCGCTVEYLQPVPAVCNCAEWVEALKPSLVGVVGVENVITPSPSLGYDDMSEFINAYGGLYVGLGVQDVKIVPGPALEPEAGGRGLVANHHPAFYADDDTLITGVRLHTHVAVDHLWAKAQAE